MKKLILLTLLYLCVGMLYAQQPANFTITVTNEKAEPVANVMEGLTQFTNATEYFILRRDSRVVNIAFTYRFGKAYKTNKRSSGSAGDEMERVGNG